jgi:hypothetical protein
MDQAIARGLAYAPYADLIWCETGTPDLAEAERFASAIHAEFPDRMLAYNCSPSFNWKRTLSDEEIAGFHERLAELGYRFQFITLAGFHTLNHSMFELAYGYRREGMPPPTPGCRRLSSRARTRLHGDPAPARGRRRLVRRGGAADRGRPRRDDGAGRLHRGEPVRLAGIHRAGERFHAGGRVRRRRRAERG